MNLFTIFVIAVGLALDAFAVAIASGVAIKRAHLRNALKIGLYFGAFQAAMPVAGWLLGCGFRRLIAPVDHWVAFGLLAAVGMKMVVESFEIERAEAADPLKTKVLLLLAVATSIDALAVGMSLSVLNVAIVLPAAVIGAVAFLLSTVGAIVGERSGHFFERRLELASGVILILIGVRILAAHIP